MADEFFVLKTRHPDIAKFLENWCVRNEKTFDFKEEADQADFYEAVLDMARHIAHTAKSASLKTLISTEGVNTVYVHVVPNRLSS